MRKCPKCGKLPLINGIYSVDEVLNMIENKSDEIQIRTGLNRFNKKQLLDFIEIMEKEKGIEKTIEFVRKRLN